jgi:hypothetical protein
MCWNSRVFPLLSSTVFSGPVQCHGIHSRFVCISGTFLILVMSQLWTWQQSFHKPNWHTFILSWKSLIIFDTWVWCTTTKRLINQTTDPRNKSDCSTHQVTDPLAVWLGTGNSLTSQTWAHDLKSLTSPSCLILEASVMSHVLVHSRLSDVRVINGIKKLIKGACSGAVGWGTAVQAGRSQVRFRWCHWNFSLT